MKCAVITGCLGGIGYAVVQKFIQEGYGVCGADCKPAETIPDELKDKPFAYCAGDIAKAADRERIVETAIKKFGRIDVLVNVAGVAPRVRADLLEMTEESYDFVMDINTKGTLFLTQAVAKQMVQNEPEQGIRGYICNISSMSAYTTSVNRGEYCISKAGVSMITALFADRLAEYGIPVNEIRPGIIATEMTSKVQEKYDKLIAGGILPIKRWGTPEDIASGVWSLCSNAISYVTGVSLDVDGGFHIQRL